MFDFIAYPIGSALKFLYDTVAGQNYGVALILLTLLVKTIMIPLAMHQKRASIAMQKLQPQIASLQEKYKADPERLNAKVSQLYQENKTNPLNGCLPSLVQMPILFALYSVLSRPLTFMYSFSADTIERLYQTLPEASQKASQFKDIGILNFYSTNVPYVSKTSDFLQNIQLPNMNFFGLNLTSIPYASVFQNGFSLSNVDGLLLLLIPVLAFLTGWIAMQTTQKGLDGKSGLATPSGRTANMMALVSPIMSGVIAMTLPAGLGLYWIVGNLFQAVQEMFISKTIQTNE